MIKKQKKDEYHKLLLYKVQQIKIEKAFNLLRRNGFEPILIKGWAASCNYPNPQDRQAGDIDLALNPQDYEKCQEFIREKTLTQIDLHCGLRHLDTVEWDNLYENSRLLELDQTKIRILREEDHLRVLCVHWLTDGGEYKERLYDIYWAVENRPVDFDWDRCLNVVSEKRRKWIICTIKLAHKYLGLDLSNIPLKYQEGDIPRWLIRTIEREWNNGTKLRPLHFCLNDRKELLAQVRKRFPPNPITATVDMEGDFDWKPRIFYQAGDILYRLRPSIKRIAEHLFLQNRYISRWKIKKIEK